MPINQSIPNSNLSDQLSEVRCLLPERFCRETVREPRETLGEVVLGQPSHHHLVLHVGSSRDVVDQITEVVPVPGEMGDGDNDDGRSDNDKDSDNGYG